MTDKTPSDFESIDGWIEDSALEKCPVCERVYSGNGGYVETVYDQQGKEYDHYLDTEPGDGPYFCADCWPELEANRKAKENKSLEEYAN